MVAVMRDDAQVIYLSGATGCSKTLLAGHKFMQWVFNAPENETQFFIICKDRGTGARNLLQNNDSFYNMFSAFREEYKAAKEGGLQFVFKGKHSDKIVYILGADDKTSWSKILGSNPDGIWLEELTELHIDCVREAMGRVLSRRCKLIATTNGGLPTQEVYIEFINHAVVQFRDSVPSVELQDMRETKPYMHYYHFNMNDDAPHLTESEKEKLAELYPPNSFYHYSKILGVRGFVEGAAYATLMQKDTHLRSDKIKFQYLQEIILSVDIGSNKNISDTSRSSTIATLVGFSNKYQRAIVMECWAIPANSHDDIIKRIEGLIEWWWVKYMEKFKKIVVDSAEAILINTWYEKNKFPTILIKGAVKQTRKEINLVSRCTLKQQLITQERLLWSDKAAISYNAHTRIRLDDNGAERDDNVQDNDIANSLDYALTENWSNLIQQDRRK
jgi:PBSX family phage terminase large subunit